MYGNISTSISFLELFHEVSAINLTEAHHGHTNKSIF